MTFLHRIQSGTMPAPYVSLPSLLIPLSLQIKFVISAYIAVSFFELWALISFFADCSLVLEKRGSSTPRLCNHLWSPNARLRNRLSSKTPGCQSMWIRDVVVLAPFVSANIPGPPCDVISAHSDVTVDRMTGHCTGLGQCPP